MRWFRIIMPVLPQLVMEVGRIDLPRAIEVGAWIGLEDGGRNLLASPVLGNLSDHFGRRRILLLALGGLAVDYVLLTIIETLPWLFVARALSGIFGGSYAAAQAGDRRHHGARGARPQFRLCWRSIRCRFRCRPRDRRFPGRDRPARAVRRRRDPCRGEYALWLFHLSRNATPRTAPDVRLAACQPARRVANDARAARKWTASLECSCCGRSPASSIR